MGVFTGPQRQYFKRGKRHSSANEAVKRSSAAVEESASRKAANASSKEDDKATDPQFMEALIILPSACGGKNVLEFELWETNSPPNPI
jgi:hypothetical protein